MSEEPQIRTLEPQPAAVEHAVTDAAGIAAAVDRAFPAIFDRLERLGVPPSGPPFTRYLETGERFELELGVPVSPEGRDLAGTEHTSLPGGRAAVLRYVGPYDGLPDACERLGHWVEERGEEGSGPFWEVYVTNPREEPDASKRVTEIYQPLR